MDIVSIDRSEGRAVGRALGAAAVLLAVIAGSASLNGARWTSQRPATDGAIVLAAIAPDDEDPSSSRVGDAPSVLHDEVHYFQNRAVGGELQAVGPQAPGKLSMRPSRLRLAQP